MTEDFLKKIAPYKNILRSYENALKAVVDNKLDHVSSEYFLSKHCRAYFFEHHLKVEREASDQEIRDISASPIVPFALSEIQLTILDKMEGRLNTGKKFSQRVMKCRRARVSTIYLAIGYHLVRFNDNKKGLVFADRLETSRKLRRILDIFYQSDDLNNKPVKGKATLCEGLYLHPSELDKDDTSRDSFLLLGSGEQRNSGIGGSLDFMHWSEASLTPDAEKSWTTISPSLQGAIFDVAESTPSLTGEDEIIFRAFERKPPHCDTMFFSWLDVREYRVDDPELEKEFIPNIDHALYGKEAEIMNDFKISIPQMIWRRKKLDDLGSIHSFRAIYPISSEEAFFSNAGLYFAKELIDLTVPKEKIKDSMQVSFSDDGDGSSMIQSNLGAWRCWSNKTPLAEYLVSVDLSEGKTADKESRDLDYSVATIWKLSKPVEEVCILRDRVPPEIMAEQCACAARYYNDALIIPEINGPGLAFLVRLRQLYNNIYREQKYAAGSFVMTEEYGFRTTSTNKTRALGSIGQLIRKDGLIIHSDIIRKEMSKFAQNGVKYGALSGHHDDTITCLWLMAVCISQNPSLIKDGYNVTNSAMTMIETKIARDNSWQWSDK